MKKVKFKPQICRIKLNPEQAVLSCTCFNIGSAWYLGWGWPRDQHFIGQKKYGAGGSIEACVQANYPYLVPGRGWEKDIWTDYDDWIGGPNHGGQFYLDSQIAVS
ncbi:MAG: hypothetical protein FJZ13_05680 [Candidatus Omnitrophica bacterium]|nr:hypothetical protein [Candidatus Omnitrophota bacterium]